jgi:hypothetical protein
MTKAVALSEPDGHLLEFETLQIRIRGLDP